MTLKGTMNELVCIDMKADFEMPFNKCVHTHTKNIICAIN